MAAKTFMKKQTNENVKKELSNSLRQTDEDDDEETEIKTVNNLIEAIEVINHYEEMIKTQHIQVILHVYIQAEIQSL